MGIVQREVKNLLINSFKFNIPGKNSLIIPLIAEKNISQINPMYKVFSAIKYLLFGTSIYKIY